MSFFDDATLAQVAAHERVAEVQQSAEDQARVVAEGGYDEGEEDASPHRAAAEESVEPEAPPAAEVAPRKDPVVRRGSIQAAAALQQPQQPDAQAVRERRGSLIALNELQKLAASNAQKAAQTKPVDVSTALQASFTFAAAMVGEAVFVMLRDWLDTTKTREKPQTAEEKILEQALAAEAIANLEKEHLSRKQADSHVPDITEKQKMQRANSVKKLTRARSVRDVVTGLRVVGRVSEAEALARRILSSRQSMYGEHVATAHAYNQLGAILAHQGKLSDAMLQFQKSLDVTRASLGVDSLCEANILVNMASVALAQSQVASLEIKPMLVEEASRFGLLAAGIYEKRYGASDERTVQLKRRWAL